MKRLAFCLLLLLCLSLTACVRLLPPTQYVRISPHSDPKSTATDTDEPVTVKDYASLKRAIRSFVQNGIEHGIIRIYSYPGNVEEDVPKAAYEIAREDPVGAYAIDYLTHDCSMFVSYYEVHIDMTFRTCLEPLNQITYVSSEQEMLRLFHSAIDSYADHLTVYAAFARNPDYESELRSYCDSEPLRHIAVPELHLTEYPAWGKPRISELTFAYPLPAASLREMEQAVRDSIQAASVYVRYRDTETEKAELLFTYLSERFSYRNGTTQTPLYSALCEGVADSQSMTESWQLLCDQVGLPCSTVSGIRGGESYNWNILSLDGQSYHVDVLDDLLNSDVLRLRYDADMEGYYWDRDSFPACVEPIPEPTEEESPEPDDSETADDLPETDPDSQQTEQTPSSETAEPESANDLQYSVKNT